MPIFEVNLTETRSFTRRITADNHLEAEHLAEGWRDLVETDKLSTAVVATEVPTTEEPLQFAAVHPAVNYDVYEHLVGDIIQPTDLVPLPLWEGTKAQAFVLAATTGRVGRVVLSHDVVLRKRGDGPFPRYPKDALEATGYNCAHLQEVPAFQAVDESCADRYPPAPEARKKEPRAMFLVISSKPSISIYDRHGELLLEMSEEDDILQDNYLYLCDLPFFPCVLTNPALRYAPLAVKKQAQATWEKLSPVWFELTTSTT